MRPFRILLSLACLLASGWLLVMYLLLRHPGFEMRAGLAFLFAAASAVLLAHAWTPGRSLAAKALAIVSALFLAYCGASAIVTNHRARAGYEGFADLIGTGFLVLGLATLGPMLLGRPASSPGPGTGAAARNSSAASSRRPS